MLVLNLFAGSMDKNADPSRVRNYNFMEVDIFLLTLIFADVVMTSSRFMDNPIVWVVLSLLKDLILLIIKVHR